MCVVTSLITVKCWPIICRLKVENRTNIDRKRTAVLGVLSFCGSEHFPIDGPAKGYLLTFATDVGVPNAKGWMFCKR